MARLSLMLIAVLAVASFFTQSAAGQFTLPKFKLPKITKTEVPATPNDPDPVSRDSDSPMSAPVPDGEVRGKPIPGAKITFSNNPDGSNPKTSFSSSEFIYGRLDLGGKTLYDVFGLKNQTDVPIYYINYDLVIYKPGEKPYAGNWGGSSSAVLKTSENPIVAAEFAKWLNTDATATEQLATEQFLFPVRTAVLESSAFADQESEFYGGQKVNQTFAEISATVDTNFAWLPFHDFVASSFNDTIGKAISEKGDLSAGLDAWQDAIVTYATEQGFTVN